MKKIISYLIAVMMLVTLIPCTASADSSCNHKWSEWEIDEEYTCCDRTAHRYCDECFEKEEKSIPATTEHSWTEWYFNESNDPCEDTYNYSYCDGCYKEKRVVITSADEEHTWSAWEYDDDYTCHERYGYRICDVCYESECELFSPTTEHKWSDWRTACGEKTAERYCLDCGEDDKKELPEVVPHNCIEWEIMYEPTCNESGIKGSYCEVCGELQEKEIPATGKHEWCEWYATDGTTCMKGGEYTRHCLDCGKAETKPFPATGKHKWSGWLVWDESTVNRYGILINYCKACPVAKEKIINRIKTVKLSNTKFTYNGKAKTPTVTVKDTVGKKLVKGKDYTVKYKNYKGKVVTKPVSVGKYSVVIKFKGNYRSTVTKSFTINPKGTAVSKLTKPAKKQIKVAWKKQSTQTTGYQIRYSTSAKFAKGKTSSVFVKGSKMTNKTIKKLKSNKKYYVQIRTYKAVNGTKYYSAWSAKKSIKTK